MEGRRVVARFRELGVGGSFRGEADLKQIGAELRTAGANVGRADLESCARPGGPRRRTMTFPNPPI